MSHGYVAVQWTRRKLVYDAILLALVVAYLEVFLLVCQGLADRAGIALDRDGVLIRAFGSAAYLLLHVTLTIGPLSRFTPLAQRLLFNRRHMGVMVFVLALLHVQGWRLPGLAGGFYGALPWYNAFGNLDPLVSVLVGNTHYDDLVRFPFESLGLVALVILFVMAATSHDFWLANLTAPVWKALHMGVYVAYAALVGHVLLGALQSHRSPWLALAVVAGLTWVVGLHLAAGWREWRCDRRLDRPMENESVDVGPLESIPDGGARMVMLAGERVAVFRSGERVYALSNVCQHQNGPLGEGRLVNGCVVCPWHGFEYRPETGASPPPFRERVPTFPVSIRQGRVLVSLPPRCLDQP
jgi:nitrite reductase/ring-hydroxylating ferredoxin subunit/DMSO/TMAO reductase YedYZ heme-binding membrane subunit